MTIYVSIQRNQIVVSKLAPLAGIVAVDFKDLNEAMEEATRLSNKKNLEISIKLS